MSACTCRPCAEGRACARKLVLSSKDRNDADRLWARFEREGTEPQYVNLATPPSQAHHPLGKAEPTGSVPCRMCRVGVVMELYLLTFLHEQKAPAPLCSSCRKVQAVPPGPRIATHPYDGDSP